MDQFEVAEYLLKQGIDANMTDDQGNTPLRLAAESKGFRVAELLIENGANVNAKNNDWYYTPLHEAASSSNLWVAELLIANGADVNAITADNNSPLDVAEGDAMQELLLRQGSINHRNNT